MSLASFGPRVAFTLAAPVLRGMLWRRVGRGREIAARLPERWGVDPSRRPPGKLLWIHAASVGETVSVLPVIAELGGITVLITTGTVTSAALLQSRGVIGPRVLHRFVPLDVPAWVGRFLDRWRPDAAAFVESELWPNMLAAARARHIPAALINARMSARSFRAWRWAPGLARAMLGGLALVAPQSLADAERLAALGARGMGVPGNLKFAAPPLPADEAELARVRAAIGTRPVWLAASLHPAEDAVIRQVHHTLLTAFPDLLTIVAPRHPDRGAALAAMFAAPRRSLGQGPGAAWIADTVGELGLLYRLAPVVFVGKSLAGGGGQNPLEPARLGCAVACGRLMGNFGDSVDLLLGGGGLTVVEDGAALAAWVARMLHDPAARTAAGEAARRAVAVDAGLPRRIAAQLLGLMDAGA